MPDLTRRRRTARRPSGYGARMSLRVAVLLVIGWAGCAAAGYGIHGLLSFAQCWDSGTVCQDGNGSTGGPVAALVIGIIAAVVGMAGGAVMFGSLFAGIGIGALTAGIQAPSGEFARSFGLLFGGFFTAIGLLAVLGAVRMRAAARRRTLVLQGGVRGVAVVLDVQDTGVSINDNPSVRLTLDVTPPDESPPFRTTVRQIVSRVRVPRPGDRLAVVLDPADPTRVLLDDHKTPLPPAPAPAPASAPPSPLDELERLARLHETGALTDEEFARLKARLIEQ